MTDTDSYLLKCALEELDKQFGKPIEQINEECACKYGYVASPENSESE